jgi:DNA-binding NarL/FixJ family response regulator
MGGEMSRVLIATDQMVLAAGMKAVLTGGGIEVVAVCEDILELFEALPVSKPDVAILDEKILPTRDVLRELYRVAPKCQWIEWPKLSPWESPERLVQTVHMMANFSGPEPSPETLVRLLCEPSERELMELVGYGLDNQEIAAIMCADKSEVQKQISSLSSRLGAEDRYELVLYGLSTLKERSA